MATSRRRRKRSVQPHRGGVPLPPSVKYWPPEAPGVDATPLTDMPRFASTWRRVAGGLIDVVPFLWCNGMPFASSSVPFLGRDWPLVVVPIYFIGMEWLFGGTLGMYAMGIRVRRLDGRKPRFHQVLLRFILLLVDGQPFFLPVVGTLLIAFNQQKQRLGDVVARTVVTKVHDRPVVRRWLRLSMVPRM